MIIWSVLYLCLPERCSAQSDAGSSSPVSFLTPDSHGFQRVRDDLRRRHRPGGHLDRQRRHFNHRRYHHAKSLVHETEVIVEAFDSYHLLELVPVQITAEDYELAILDENLTDWDKTTGDANTTTKRPHCQYNGRTHGGRQNTAFIDLCQMEGIFTSLADGEDILIERDSNGGRNARKITPRSLCTMDDDSESTRTSLDNEKPKLPSKPAPTSRRLERRKLDRSIRQARYNKRSSFARQMSIAVFVDPSLTYFFRQFQSTFVELETYVQSVMGIASQILHDPTLKQDIEVKMRKLTIIPHEKDGPSYRLLDFNSKKDMVDADILLTNFCHFQQQQNEINPENYGHWDVAVYITKHNLCTSDGTCDTLGLAEKYSICSPSKSCTVIEDTGLATAFTIAHEIGHLLGAIHDSDIGCEMYGGEYGVMSPILQPMHRPDTTGNRLGPWRWSQCSAAKIRHSMDLGRGDCLNKRYNRHVSMMRSVNPMPRFVNRLDEIENNNLAIEVMTEHEQCQLIFGKDSYACVIPSQKCSRLWCQRTVYSNGKRNKICVTKHMPWADRTPCTKGSSSGSGGPSMWCQSGQCVAKSSQSEAPRPVHGAWSQWQPWGHCSFPCGNGVRRRRRLCDQPKPFNGGDYCSGAETNYELCNRQPCTRQVDRRQEQCNVVRLQNTRYGTKKVELQADWGSGCILSCVDPLRSWLSKKDNGHVVDGTKCARDGDDVCIGGKCAKVGCDGQLYGSATYDICGVCGGTGSTCRPVDHRHYTGVQDGWKDMEMIASNSTQITIEQTDSYPFDGVSLCLYDPIRNSDYWPRVSIKYTGAYSSPELITIEGTIPNALLVKSYQADVRANFAIRIKYNEPRLASRYEWIMRDYEQCDHVCNGHQARRAGCVSTMDFRRVDDANCNRHQKPKSESRACNEHCELKWQRTKTSQCSTDCGFGTRTVVYKCIRQAGQKTTLTGDIACERQRLRRPSQTEKCRAKCPIWSYSEWTECSATCGNGIRTRTRSCLTATGATSSSCDQAQSASLSQACNTTPCPQWSAGPWTGCSRSCGGGERKRMISCFYNYREIDNHYCNEAIKPLAIAPCNTDPCAVWSYSPWSPCSVSCGQGQEVRNVTCLIGSRPDPGQCAHLRRDIITRPCSLQQCANDQPVALSGTWRTSGWSECSGPCGTKGIHTRRVHCEIAGAEVDGARCPVDQRPVDIDNCFSPCPVGKGEWVTGQWSSCTKTCGPGAVRKRAIGCRLGSSYKQFTNCDQAKRPQTIIPCNVPSCPVLNHNTMEIPDFFKLSTFEWRYGDWQKCDCGKSAQKRRPVTCNEIKPSNQVEVVTSVDTAKCDAAKRPPSSEPCQCRLRWRAGRWSKCDAKCGGGHQTRNIACYRGDQKVSPKNCMRVPRIQSTKPRQKRPCKSQSPCPRWRRTSWTPCSTKCGIGYQTRQLKCQLRHTRRIIDTDKCESLPKPKVRRKCRARIDCDNAQWSPGNYGPCSATCTNVDDGNVVMQRRTISCHYNGRNIGDTYCVAEEKPLEERTCNLDTCVPPAEWLTSDWGPCSVTCGRGIMLRTADCTGGSCPAAKPETTKVCDLGSCKATNCKDIQRLRKQSLNGNYYIEVEGKLIKVYCHLMKTSSPREYLNVIEKENFSMIYEYQLKNTTSCPAKLHRSDLIVNPRKRGRTTYKKVRFLPDKLQILTTDSTFSKTVGTRIEFGSAGDCFSSGGCPKGLFSINLESTGLKVSNRQRWRVRGKKGHMEMWRPKTGTQLRAKCGGLCAQCQPTHSNIIQLELNDI